MRPESASRRLFGITRAKGKMYEFALPEALHIAIPEGTEPESLLLLTVGTVGDIAALIGQMAAPDVPLSPDAADEIGFSASYFDALLASGFSQEIHRDVMLLAASAYYLARRPGSSLVLARRLGEESEPSPVDALLRWLLQARWSEYPQLSHPVFGSTLGDIARLLAYHFHDGSNVVLLNETLASLRRRAYKSASARDLLLVDVVAAVVRLRLAASAWQTLPQFTQIPIDTWAPVIRRQGFPKELWPSQILLGRAGMFSGTSGVIQMPTSAGKTRSVEIVLRSGFLSKRMRLAVVVAPFKALCHEIGTSLRSAFKDDDVKVNELTDALQLDFLDQVSELLGGNASTSSYVLVLTPEKLLYVLRQAPALVQDIGAVVYDEGHQFDSGSRGITYELLLTEIKELLPATAQTVLVSAVMRNAEEVGRWLIGDRAVVVDGSGLLPTARSVAFATWLERLGQFQFFESGSFDRSDYFVPRAIDQQKLERLGKEQKDRHFPEKGDDAWKDVSLYMGIRLAPQGAVAIFCGRKDTATGMAERAVDVYERGYSVEPPARAADPVEVGRLVNLLQRHFGVSSMIARAAALGVFVHHGNTPHGVRLCIEHAMQRELIKLVACTSTLAQGVNLPIRYLIVSGIHQGGDQIKTRDFQNLIGRAGRAGMHTEGLVIFADPRVLDKRRTESWRFNAAVNLLDAGQSENTTSTLLTILGPISSPDGKSSLPIALADIPRLLLSDVNSWPEWAAGVARRFGGQGFKAKDVLGELKYRRRLLSTLESYLMANRGSDDFNTFRARVRVLASSTLAYRLAADEQREVLVNLFELVADHVQRTEPAPEKQAVYAKTLLGVDGAKAVEVWVQQGRDHLLSLSTSDEWLVATWPLFSQQIDDKFFQSVEPASLPQELAGGWLAGKTYGDLIALSGMRKATKPWGDSKRRRLSDADVMDFLEGTLGFDCALVLAAVAQSLSAASSTEGGSASLALFQKSLKYGLPDWLSISCVERGFADRVVALDLRDKLVQAGYSDDYFGRALVSHRQTIEDVLSTYPAYFESVISSLGGATT
jgi:POLQ-like helicase